MFVLRRREFITLLGGAAAWPLPVDAQQPIMPVVGFLSSLSASVTGKRVVSFGQGLTETGYVVGRDWSSSVWRMVNTIDYLHLRPILCIDG